MSFAKKGLFTTLVLVIALFGVTSVWAQGGGFIYVGHCHVDSAPEVACTNDVWALAIDGANGALTPVTGSPFMAGKDPQRLTVDPAGQFVYVPNLRDSNVSAFKITAGSGALIPVAGSPFPAGVFPTGVTTDPRASSYMCRTRTAAYPRTRSTVRAGP